MTTPVYPHSKVRMGWVGWLGCIVIVFGGGPAAAFALLICYASGSRSNYAWFRLACGVVGWFTLIASIVAALFVAGAVVVGDL
jgi:hypothetical protein